MRLDPISISSISGSDTLDLASVVVRDYLHRLDPKNLSTGVYHYLMTNGQKLKNKLDLVLKLNSNSIQPTSFHSNTLPKLLAEEEAPKLEGFSDLCSG